MTVGGYLDPGVAEVQKLAPINMRAMSTALFFLILNLIALGGGPTYIGLASSALTEQYGEVHALRLSITSLIVPYISPSLHFFGPPKPYLKIGLRLKRAMKRWRIIPNQHRLESTDA